MTAQFPDRLQYQGKMHSLFSNPLGDFLLTLKKQPQFDMSCSALWRGYVANWLIENDQLYLLAVEGKLEDGTTVNIDTLFPNCEDRVFAGWFSGELRVPIGRQLRYVHMGYSSVYEHDLFLQIEKGHVHSVKLQPNAF